MDLAAQEEPGGADAPLDVSSGVDIAPPAVKLEAATEVAAPSGGDVGSASAGSLSEHASMQLSIKELKAELERRGVDISAMLERSELELALSVARQEAAVPLDTPREAAEAIGQALAVLPAPAPQEVLIEFKFKSHKTYLVGPGVWAKGSALLNVGGRVVVCLEQRKSRSAAR